MKFSFSTLACPSWDLDRIIEYGVKYAYHYLELRFINNVCELEKMPELSPKNIFQTLQKIKRAGLEVVSLDSSVHLHSDNDADWNKNLEQAKQYIDAAQILEAKYIRVFPNQIPHGKDREWTLKRIAQGLTELGPLAIRKGVRVALETHGDFCDTVSIRKIMEQVNHAGVGVLWDAHHPYRFCKEDFSTSYMNLKKYLCFIHLKDSRGEPPQHRLHLLGEGDIPFRNLCRLLKENDYEGVLGEEFEKAWHPYAAEPEIGIPHFIRTIRSYFSINQ